MNNWLAWALPLVALGVWILSNLIKNAQDEARRRDMRPRPNPEQENSQRREIPPPRKIERPRPPVRQQPVARPTPVQERPRPGRQPAPVRVVRRAEMVTDQIIVGQLVEQEAAGAPTVSRSNISATRKPNKSVQNMLALLKSKNTLATAFLLTEVFGKPRCKR
jgi:hypothetical protein